VCFAIFGRFLAFFKVSSKKTVFKGESARNDGTREGFVKLKNVAKDGQKGQNCYLPSPGSHGNFRSVSAPPPALVTNTHPLNKTCAQHYYDINICHARRAQVHHVQLVCERSLCKMHGNRTFYFKLSLVQPPNNRKFC
jgi:hypothetical protein